MVMGGDWIPLHLVRERNRRSIDGIVGIVLPVTSMKKLSGKQFGRSTESQNSMLAKLPDALASTGLVSLGYIYVNIEHECEVQKSYWVEHSVDLTLHAMMLDSKPSYLDKEERPEVLSMLPPYEGKSALELGAGIGRFIGEIAKKAGQLTAIDFIESIIKKMLWHLLSSTLTK